MAAADHLGPQFIHGTPEKLSPGDFLTREAAWTSQRRRNGASEGAIQRAADQHRRFNFEEPKESHLYYGDSSLSNDVHNMYGAGGHVYAVQPETSNGRKINKHSPDPHYSNYGGGAYRTTGRLRVLHEIDEQGNKVGD